MSFTVTTQTSLDFILEKLNCDSFLFPGHSKTTVSLGGREEVKSKLHNITASFVVEKLRKTNFSMRKRVRKCKALPQFGTLNKLRVEMGNGRKTLKKRLLIKVFVYN